MNTDAQKNRSDLSGNQLDYGKGGSLLDMFFQCYTEYYPLETAKTKSMFGELERYMAVLGPDGMDTLFDCVSALLAEQERLAFQEGMRTGVRWMLEMLDTEIRH